MTTEEEKSEETVPAGITSEIFRPFLIAGLSGKGQGSIIPPKRSKK